MARQRNILTRAEDVARTEAIMTAMRKAKAVRLEAARLLGKSPAWLYAEIRRLGLSRQVLRLERELGRETWAPGRPKRRAA